MAGDRWLASRGDRAGLRGPRKRRHTGSGPGLWLSAARFRGPATTCFEADCESRGGLNRPSRHYSLEEQFHERPKAVCDEGPDKGARPQGDGRSADGIGASRPTRLARSIFTGDWAEVVSSLKGSNGRGSALPPQAPARPSQSVAAPLPDQVYGDQAGLARGLDAALPDSSVPTHGAHSASGRGSAGSWPRPRGSRPGCKE